MRVAFQVPAFKEPELSETLDAWAEQQPPEWASVSYEAWITPSTEHREACGTWQQAEAHPTFEAFEAPQYKLPTRNEAHFSAVERGADAIVVADADAPPLSEETLSALLTALSEPSVGCAVANPVANSTPIGIRSNIGVGLKEVIGGIHGQCHALTAEAWGDAGPFETDGIDHTEVMSVWREEEYRFGKRLRKNFDVVYEYDAPVYNDIRRRVCTWRKSARRHTDDPFCEKAEGDETFAPQ